MDQQQTEQATAPQTDLTLLQKRYQQLLAMKRAQKRYNVKRWQQMKEAEALFGPKAQS
jgi:hypothetical protein